MFTVSKFALARRCSPFAVYIRTVARHQPWFKEAHTSTRFALASKHYHNLDLATRGNIEKVAASTKIQKSAKKPVVTVKPTPSRKSAPTAYVLFVTKFLKEYKGNESAKQRLSLAAKAWRSRK